MLLWIQCGANDGVPQKYVDDCEKVLDELMKENDLIFGACNHGIMGCAYRSALKNKRIIIGSSPKVYEGDYAEVKCDEEITTDGIIESTVVMLDRCDAAVVMPGGLGTLYEFFLMMQGSICHEQKKKIVIYNSCGFYDELLDYLGKLLKEGFVEKKHLAYFKVARDSKELKKMLSEPF